MRLLLFLLPLAVLFSCGTDPDSAAVEAAETLEGRWELVEARRDNVRTNLLEGLYFVFGPEQAFETNLLTGEAQRGKYYVEDTEITTQGVAVPMTYEIQSLEGGVLTLRSRYEGFLFDFMLQRGGTPAGGDAGAMPHGNPES